MMKKKHESENSRDGNSNNGMNASSSSSSSSLARPTKRIRKKCVGECAGRSRCLITN